MRSGIITAILVFIVGHFQFAQAQCNACERQTNRIVNGDFESGNTGFTSAFNYVTFFPFICTLCPENNYAIGNNATLFHNDFIGNDHTNPPSGDFFIANAPGSPGTNAWCQTLSVAPNTDYTLTFWARDVTDNPNAHPLALLIPTFNNIPAGDTLVAAGGWSSLTTTWNSGQSTTLNVCITDVQSQTGGNDFGLDDISLIACEPIHLSQNAFAGNDATICSNTPLQLGQTALAGYNYQWSSGSGLSAFNISNPTFLLANETDSIITEDFIITRDSANVGCIASDTLSITILPIHDLDLESDISICPFDSVALTIPNLWDTQTWFDGSHELSIYASAGNAWVSVTEGNCTQTDTVLITVISIPSTGLPDSIQHCNTDLLLLDAGFDGTWLWNNDSATNPITAIESATYFFHYAANGCEAADTLTVTLYDEYFAQLPADTVLCEGTTVTITSDHPGYWNTGLYASAMTIAIADTFAIAVSNGPCTTHDTIVIAGILQPAVWLGNDSTFCEDYPLMLDASAPQNNSYLWSTGDTTSTTITTGSDGYRIEVSNVCGTVSDEIIITNYPCSWQLFAPSSFTPNDDDFNPGWYVTGYNIRSIDLRIYNRFGDSVFHTTTWEEAWKPSESIGDDIYNYRINATAFNGEQVIQTGTIYLLR